MSDEVQQRTKIGVRTTIIGLAMNILLCSAKILVGLLFHSVSVLADGLNNLTDAGSGVVNILGFKWSEKPADKEHPFGHARYEYLAGLIIAFIVLFFGIETAITSVEKIVGGGKTDPSIYMWITLGAGVAIKLLMFLLYTVASKKISSSALKAAAGDSLGDCVTTSAVLICAVIAAATGVETDGYVGIAVALFLLFNGAKLLKSTVSPLLGEKPTKDLVEKISRICLAYEGVEDIHDLIVHNYGPNRYFATVHLEVDAAKDPITLHEIVDGVERELQKQGINLVAHMDPVLCDERSEEMKRIAYEELKAIDGELRLHDFRVVPGAGQTTILFDMVAPFEFRLTDKELKERMTARLKARIEDANPIITVEKEMS